MNFPSGDQTGSNAGCGVGKVLGAGWFALLTTTAERVPCVRWYTSRSPSGAHDGLMLSERASVALLRIFPSGVAIQTPSVPPWFVTNAIGGSVTRTELRDASATTRAAVRAVAAATTRTSTCASDFDLPQ